MREEKNKDFHYCFVRGWCYNIPVSCIAKFSFSRKKLVSKIKAKLVNVLFPQIVCVYYKKNEKYYEGLEWSRFYTISIFDFHLIKRLGKERAYFNTERAFILSVYF